MVHIPCTYCKHLDLTDDHKAVICKKFGKVFESGNVEACDSIECIDRYAPVVRQIRKWISPSN